MGASESTAKTNGANEEEEQQRHTDPVASLATAAAGVAAVGMAAWGISKMLSDTQQKQDPMNFSNSCRLQESSSIPRTNIPRITRPSAASHGFKMNTDGTCRPNQGRPGGYTGDGSIMRGPSGYGGILRDDRGKLVRGFRGFIGDDTDCLTAEIHGILHGLQLFDKLGIVDSNLVTDGVAAIEWINQESYRHRPEVIEDCWDIITECKRLKNKNRITISCCSRNDNKCAHKLASLAIDKRDSYVEIMNPDEIKNIVNAESNLSASNYSIIPRPEYPLITRPPSAGRRFKMNTDGRCRPHVPHGYKQDGSVMRGPGGYGGILVDHRGRWVRGFRGFIVGKTDNLTAEFHGIHKGLRLLVKHGVVNSYLVSDYEEAVNWINGVNGTDLESVTSDIVKACWDMITECWLILKNNNRITVHCSLHDTDNERANKQTNKAIDNEDPYVETDDESP